MTDGRIDNKIDNSQLLNGMFDERGGKPVVEIAVCDDTPGEREQVTEYAGRFFESRGVEAHIDAYETGALLLASEKEYDLYLLDVLMPEMDGIETAEGLARLKERPVVVFITSSLEAAVEGYRVEAAGFILKPVEEENFTRTLERVSARRLGALPAFINVIHNRVPVKLNLERVAWFENRLHRVYVALEGGEVLTIHQKLSQIQELIRGRMNFLRCHQSYIVNLDHVDKLEDSCFYMREGRIIPVSRNFYKQSKNAFYHYRLK